MDNIDIFNDIDKTELVLNAVVDHPDQCVNFLENANNQYTIVCQNIRSVQKNINSFIVFLSSLNFLPDIIIFTECRINEDSPDLTLPNYSFYSSKKYINQNDGIIVFSKPELHITIEEPNFKDANCLLLHIGNKLSIIAIYRTPSIRKIDRFCHSLETILQTIKSESCIMVGDYNIDIRNDENDPDPLATDYLDLTGHYGFIPGHKLPTRGLRCLDHVMINSKKSTQILIYDSDITDHRTIILGIDRLAHATNITNNRTSSKINYQGIVCDLEKFNPTNLYAHTDITIAVQDFTKIITELITKHTTTKLMKNREVLLKPWITPNLLKCIRKKSALQLLMKKNPKDGKIHETYKNYRNTCINLIHDLKMKYEENLLKAAHGDSKQTWKCIKSICNLNKKTNKNSLINESDNGSDAVNNVNRYFTSVGKDLADNILSSLSMTQKELVSLVSSSLTSTPVNSFFISPTDTYEITKIITSLKAASAPGESV
ncbi:Uncharacterized protein OBRU01_00042 [Operophtera brumata]|uniref:Tick transposon n=1 Tax=Operophtera brumata TaxID=104452 RepID=A0A0L7LVR7_OPEBR|nr:Uncharacterized protein OBRU01_00042 [Operophtera brumata]